jgi:hypothetical protein
MPAITGCAGTAARAWPVTAAVRRPRIRRPCLPGSVTSPPPLTTGPGRPGSGRRHPARRSPARGRARPHRDPPERGRRPAPHPGHRSEGRPGTARTPARPAAPRVPGRPGQPPGKPVLRDTPEGNAHPRQGPRSLGTDSPVRGMSTHSSMGCRCMIQPVAQTPIKALAPEDLGLLGSRNTRYGVESILAPFMQQAGLCSYPVAHGVEPGLRTIGRWLCSAGPGKPWRAIGWLAGT